MGRIRIVVLTLMLLASAGPGRAASRDITLPRRSPHTALDEPPRDGRPSPAAIALLRAHTRHRRILLALGDTLVVARDAEIDSLGVSCVDAHGGRGRFHASWNAIGRLETRRSNALIGLVTGTLVMTVGALALAGAAGPDPGPGILVVIVMPPCGAVIGGLAGVATHHWRHEWPPLERRAGH